MLPAPGAIWVGVTTVGAAVGFDTGLLHRDGFLLGGTATVGLATASAAIGLGICLLHLVIPLLGSSLSLRILLIRSLRDLRWVGRGIGYVKRHSLG